MYKLLIVGMLFMTSCGWMNRQVQHLTGTAVSTCQNGVSYLQFSSGVSVEYNVDGTIKTCK